MSFAPDFSPDRTSNILRPKAWGKAFLQLSLHAHTLLSPRDFCLLSESWRHKWATHFTVFLSGLMAAGTQVGCFSSVCQKETRFSEKGCTFSRWGKLPGERPWSRTSSAFPHNEMEEPFISGHQEAALLTNQSPEGWSCSSLQDEPSVFWSEQLFLTSGDPVENLLGRVTYPWESWRDVHDA